MANLDWWVVASKPLPAESIGQQVSGGQTAPPGSRVVSTVQGSATDNLYMSQRDQPTPPKSPNGLYAIFGPFTTKAAAQAAVTSPAPGRTNAVPGLGGIQSIGQFFDKLSEASTWIRVGEVLLGLALIIVGAAKLFSNTSVGRAAEKAGKVAMLI